MNREIKFRVWDFYRQRMITGDVCSYASFYDDGTVLCGGVIEPNTLMQYTGLKDKNGKEIYEGDVIQYKTYTTFKRWWSKIEEIPEIEKQFEERKKDFQIVRAPIRFTDGQFMLSHTVDGYVIARGEKVETSHTPYADCEEKWWDFEVIGNIYENADLLK